MNFNSKLSGAKAVFVPITKIGKNPLPFIEDLRKRVIKFIDFYPTNLLPGTGEQGLLLAGDSYTSITLASETGNEYLHKDLPLLALDYVASKGARMPICNIISLQNSYINNTDAGNIGRTAMLVFWYDLPNFSRKNNTDLTVTDALSIPITSVTQPNLMPDEERLSLKRYRRILFAGKIIYTPDRHEAIGVDEAKNLFITLRKGSYNVIENVPLYMFMQWEFLTKQEFANITFDLQNSYITVGGAANVDPKAYEGKYVFLNLVYEK